MAVNKMTSSKILIKILLLVILSQGIIFGQIDTSLSTKDYSNASDGYSEFKIKLNHNPNVISPLFAIKQPLYYTEFSQFYIPSFEQKLIDKPISIMQLKREMNQTMKIYRQGTIKNDLGFVGDILGYTNAAAALGLAIYHVSKNPKKYGLK